MSFYQGSTEPVTAAEVAIGDLLVHDKADAGYLTVTDARNDGQVSLLFETGDAVTYPPDLRLYRVTPLAGPGQAWADNDRRSAGRRVRIVEVDFTHATVQHPSGGRETRIRLDRFRPTSTGYRLVQDVED